MCKGFLRHTTSVLLVAMAALATLGMAACGGGNAYQGLSASELWARAQQEFAEEDWEEAAEMIERLLTTSGEFEERAEARLLLADAYYNDEQYITAHADYSRFLQQYPGHPQAPRAALGTCRSMTALSPIPARDQTYTEQAASTCQNVVRDYTGVDDEVAAEARELFNRMRSKLGEKAFENAEFYASRDFWDSAIIYYEHVVDQFADTRWAPRAILGLIQAYETIGYEEEREEWRQRLLDSYPDSPEAQRVSGGGGDVGADGAAVRGAGGAAIRGAGGAAVRGAGGAAARGAGGAAARGTGGAGGAATGGSTRVAPGLDG